MTRMWKVILMLGGVAFAATAATAAFAQVSGDRATPSGWNYEIKDGKRVPKGDRKVNADGSWREEIRQGKCVTIKEKSAAGEYKETRRCD
jgi:hypothetical protein